MVIPAVVVQFWRERASVSLFDQTPCARAQQEAPSFGGGGGGGHHLLQDPPPTNLVFDYSLSFPDQLPHHIPPNWSPTTSPLSADTLPFHRQKSVAQRPQYNPAQDIQQYLRKGHHRGPTIKNTTF